MKNELKSTVIRLLHSGRVQHDAKTTKELTIWTADDNVVCLSVVLIYVGLKIGSCWLDEIIRMGFVIESCSFKLYVIFFQRDTSRIVIVPALLFLQVFMYAVHVTLSRHLSSRKKLWYINSEWSHITKLQGEDGDRPPFYCLDVWLWFFFLNTFKYLLLRTSKDGDSFTSLFASPFPCLLLSCRLEIPVKPVPFHFCTSNVTSKANIWIGYNIIYKQVFNCNTTLNFFQVSVW